MTELQASEITSEEVILERIKKHGLCRQSNDSSSLVSNLLGRMVSIHCQLTPSAYQAKQPCPTVTVEYVMKSVHMTCDGRTSQSSNASHPMRPVTSAGKQE